ncbi:MAG: hypothetical protein J3K34DRAFT_441829 [Monoraphidium minutum]|nr:MAG: hypothetical protein J3K34DRAFT_441829 [Monoraphidium minutum]
MRANARHARLADSSARCVARCAMRARQQGAGSSLQLGGLAFFWGGGRRGSGCKCWDANGGLRRGWGVCQKPRLGRTAADRPHQGASVASSAPGGAPPAAALIADARRAAGGCRRGVRVRRRAGAGAAGWDAPLAPQDCLRGHCALGDALLEQS